MISHCLTCACCPRPCCAASSPPPSCLTSSRRAAGRPSAASCLWCPGCACRRAWTACRLSSWTCTQHAASRKTWASNTQWCAAVLAVAVLRAVLACCALCSCVLAHASHAQATDACIACCSAGACAEAASAHAPDAAPPPAWRLPAPRLQVHQLVTRLRTDLNQARERAGMGRVYLTRDEAGEEEDPEAVRQR